MSGAPPPKSPAKTKQTLQDATSELGESIFSTRKIRRYAIRKPQPICVVAIKPVHGHPHRFMTRLNVLPMNGIQRTRQQSSRTFLLEFLTFLSREVRCEIMR
jgi:hypothetical protein